MSSYRAVLILGAWSVVVFAAGIYLGAATGTFFGLVDFR
jgi:hypothetical protein